MGRYSPIGCVLCALFTIFQHPSALAELSPPNTNVTHWRDLGQTPRWTMPRESYQCHFSLSSLPKSSIELTVYLLVRRGRAPAEEPKDNNMTDRSMSASSSSYVFLEPINSNATIEDIQASGVDPSLPLTIFVNGFNHDSELRNSWMYKTAEIVTAQDALSAVGQLKPRSNYLFFYWRIPKLFASNLLSALSAYYRTMACYEIVLERVSTAVVNLIDFIEHENRSKWLSRASRLDFYSQFQFFGHSLGAHLMADVVNLAHESRPHAKYGQLVGLDPASLCFGDNSLGLTADNVANSTNQVIVIHSNAGVLGVGGQRAHVDIVLNGGSFMPTCSWYDVACSHELAASVLKYADNQCQMVAYRCANYEQFKHGACGTCDHGDQAGCILVNLPEQHINDDKIASIVADDGRIRKLADGDDIRSLNETQHDNRCDAHGLHSSKIVGFKYYANTNPNFGPESNTHCLQHYQARLLVLADDPSALKRCPLGAHISRRSPGISIRSLYDSTGRTTMDVSTTLTESLPETIYTGLVTFVSQRKLFEGALVEGLNLDGWTACLRRQQVEGDVSFVLDIAFMSHIEQRVRHAYSSILCADWSGANDTSLPWIKLSLCKQSDLANTSGHINDILEGIKFKGDHNPWHLWLLNGLFSLFAEWEPFRRSAI